MNVDDIVYPSHQLSRRIKPNCSRCGDFLGDLLGRSRYCRKCSAESSRRNRKQYKDLTPEEKAKGVCRSKARNLLKKGLIKKQLCKNCSSADSQMHHGDYNKPEKVEWLCRKCHIAEHHFHKAQVAQPVLPKTDENKTFHYKIVERLFQKMAR